MEEPIILRGSYPLRWRDYGQPFPRTNGRFRYLAVETSPAAVRFPAGLNAGAPRCANRCFRERSARGWSCRYFRLAAIGYRVSLALPLPAFIGDDHRPVRGEGDSFHLTVPFGGEPSNCEDLAAGRDLRDGALPGRHDEVVARRRMQFDPGRVEPLSRRPDAPCEVRDGDDHGRVFPQPFPINGPAEDRQPPSQRAVRGRLCTAAAGTARSRHTPDPRLRKPCPLPWHGR